MRRARRLCGAAGVTVLAGVLVMVLAGGAVEACSAGGSGEPRPVASLSSTPAAGVAFEAIRQAWRSPEHDSVAELEPMLQSFLARFPGDGRVPSAHVLLALVAMRRNDLAAADRQLAISADLPAGSIHDLYTVARARRLRLGGDAEAALDMLRPLVGKNVDPIARTVFQEELTLAALATHREYEAISYMDAWLRASAEDEKERTVLQVQRLVERLPQEVLLGALQAMRAQRASYGYGVDIERILATRLVGIATTSGNAQLARVLLDPHAGAVVIGGDAGVELGALATSRRGLNSVEGRTVGLLLPTDSPVLRDEAAAVLRGVMWALGLPPGVREADAGAPPGKADGGGDEPGGYACAPPEAAPPPGEPSAADGLRLVTRDDGGTEDRTEVALDELVGEGAALVIAGLDGATSARALRWGSNHGVAVVAIAPPESDLTGGAGAPLNHETGAFGFVAGSSRSRVMEALTRAAPVLGTDPVAPVVDASEWKPSSPGAPASPAAPRLLPPFSCDAPVQRAGDPRFPFAAWQAAKVRGWVVSGSPGCAVDLLSEMTSRPRSAEKPVVVMTLESASRPAHGAFVRVLTASAGLVPSRIAAAADDEVRRFGAILGDDTLGYWAAVGRDAATLARVALRRLPGDTVSDAAAVSARRAQARDDLAAARAALWSTEAAGWSELPGGGHVLKRTLCALEVPPTR
jgi:hypothetical protein